MKKPKKEPQVIGSSGSQAIPIAPPPSQEPVMVTDSPSREEPPISLAGQPIRQVIDPLDGMDPAVRANITQETEELVRSSGSKYYTHIVRTMSSSNISSPRDPKATVFPIAELQMAEPEVESIPMLAKLSSKERTKIYTDMFKAVPKEYRQSLPGFEEAQIGQMQAIAADVHSLILCIALLYLSVLL